ncbi:MAG: cohesin domain-containing protein, partial [Oscillospiraceae bacterium]|nr:cohesin domain-containing protein [Oscillospiraceae bacterium]
MQTSKLRNRKSLLSILLTLAMVISMLPTLAIPISAAPEVKIAFDPPGPGPIEVTAVEFDYETEVTQTVKVVNDGDDPTGVITIGIDSSANPDCFKWAVGGSSIEDVNEISTEDIPEFNTLGDEVEITVILITDCDPGTYTATINVTSVAGLNDSIDIIFTINPEPVVSISLTPSEEEITVVEDGYGPEASIVVAVENVGNVPTGALTADIESDDLDCFEWAIGSAPFAPATVPNDMASIPSLAVSGTSTITITLIPGCTPGIYIAFITVSNADVSAMSVPLVFKVNANPTGNANYTVRYNTGEGNPAISDKQGVAWTDANLLPTETLTRAGYEFGGWYTEPNGGGYQVTNNTTYSQLANHNVEIMSVDIYANWVGTVPTLAVGSVVGVAGKTISVPVTASDSPLLASLKFDVNYDTDALILTDLTLPSNSGFSALIGPDPGQDMISLVPNRTDSINPNGALLTLTFEISENAVLSEYLISLQNIKASDEKDIKIQFSVEDGSVKVVR